MDNNYCININYIHRILSKHHRKKKKKYYRTKIRLIGFTEIYPVTYDREGPMCDCTAKYPRGLTVG